MDQEQKSFHQLQKEAFQSLSGIEAMKAIKKNSHGVKFTHEVTISTSGHHAAILNIENLAFTRFGTYSVINRIWWKMRKAVIRLYGTDAAIHSLYDEAQKAITCQFQLNCGLIEQNHIGLETYYGMFKDTFPMQARVLESLILKFIDDEEDGYAAYLKYGVDHPKAGHAEFDAIIDNFLVKNNIIKPKKSGKTPPP